MKNKYIRLFLILVFSLCLSGCTYSNSRRFSHSRNQQINTNMEENFYNEQKKIDKADITINMTGKEFAHYLSQIVNVDEYEIKIERRNGYTFYNSNNLMFRKNSTTNDVNDEYAVYFYAIENSEEYHDYLNTLHDTIYYYEHEFSKEDKPYVLDFKILDNSSIFIESEDSFSFKSLKGNILLEFDLRKEYSTKDDSFKIIDDFYTDKFENFNNNVSFKNLFAIDFYMDTENLTLEEIVDKIYILEKENYELYGADYYNYSLRNEFFRLKELSKSSNYKIDSIEGKDINDFINDLLYLLPEGSEFYFDNVYFSTDSNYLDYLSIYFSVNYLNDNTEISYITAYPMSFKDIEKMQETFNDEELFKKIDDKVYYSRERNVYNILGKNIIYEFDFYGVENLEKYEYYKELLDILKEYSFVINPKSMIDFYLN